MREDYEELLKLNGTDYWEAMEQRAAKRLEHNIEKYRQGSVISSEEQKKEYELLLIDYNNAIMSEASHGGIDAITDVFDWFKLDINEFSPKANYWLITNMISEQASIAKANALEYGDEWLANQYGSIGTRTHY